MCSGGCIRVLSATIGVFLCITSVLSIGFSLFLLFGEPLGDFTRGTYTPNAEDIGPALFCSVVSLVMNVVLIGGALQYSKGMVLAWIIWKMILLAIFWSWYAYNQLKHYGYVEWSGMRGCYFCGLRPEEEQVSTGGAGATLVLILCMVPVIMLHAKLKKRHRELTELQDGREGGSFYDARLDAYQQHQQYPMMEYKYAGHQYR